MKIDTYDKNGAKKGSVELNKVIFEAKINPDLMHQAVVMKRSNERTPVAHVKTRGEVVMTRAKAFRQKGTGRARRGSLTTNLLRGGGAVHAPRNVRNFSRSMPKRQRRAALFSSLSAKAKDQALFGWEGFAQEAPKTKAFASLLGKLPVGKKTLFVLEEKTSVFERSARNIPHVKVALASYLHPYDVLGAEKICFVGNALQKMEQTFLPNTP